ncbi:MAG: hypothetical protein R2878_14310, partial [Thermoleophilia bacterium]
AGRPVLCSDRGCLREAVADHPGAEVIEPDRAGIIRGIRALTPERWTSLRAAALSSDRPWDLDAWLDAYRDAFHAAATGGPSTA